MTRKIQRKIWRAPAATSLLAVGGLVGCGTDEPVIAVDSAPTAGMSMAAGEGEGSSEVLALSTDDAAYLTQIGLMRGHLWVGHELYLNELADLSATHMKHPEAELYSTLVDAFEMRGVAGFADALSTLSARVSDKRSVADVQQAYDALQQRIAASESGADTGSAPVIGRVIVELLRTAAEEYAVGVVDGQINNVHEYQDALGFTQIARQWARSPVFAGDAQTVAVAAFIQATLDDLTELWPELAPTAAVPFEAAQIYGAAAQIELRVLGLE
ncbi:MAG: hypothetical protein AB8B93_07945 [Pseudomonadales bacterium]